MPERKSHPELTIIIVNRNTSNLLIECLSRVKECDDKQSFETVVIDNGSTDDSVSRVKALFPDVSVIEAGRNLGFASANNLGFSMSNGEFVLLLNTDALLDKDCVSRMLTLAKSDERVALVGPQLLNEDGTNQTSFEATPTLLTETTNRSLLKRLFPKRYPGKNERLSQPKDVETIIGAVMLVKRKAFDDIGGFDPDYFFFFEETDLALRLRLAGWRVMHEPSAKCVHLQGRSASAHASAARIEFYRSRYIFFEKFYGSKARRFLKTVIMLNLSINFVTYGAMNLVTLGLSEKLHNKFEIWKALSFWHMAGCPNSVGLPRD